MFCVPATAQSTTTYYSGACVKVHPGGDVGFASEVSGNMLKLEESRLKAGKITGWLAMRAVVPQGKHAHCDYLFVTFFKGLPTPPMSDSEFTAALHEAGLEMTPEEFWEPIMKDASLVSTDVGEMAVMIGSSSKGGYVVDNSMHMPDVNECRNTETKLWQPFAESRIKAGQQTGWGMYEIVYPRGSMVKGSTGTVDFYSSWDQIFMEGFEKTWQEVHPDVKVADAMAEFNQQCSIEMSEVYEVVEDVQAPME
jgi:hypothetical protein